MKSTKVNDVELEYEGSSGRTRAIHQPVLADGFLPPFPNRRWPTGTS